MGVCPNIRSTGRGREGLGYPVSCRAGWAQTRHAAGWPRSASRWNVGLIEHQEGLGLCGEPCVCLCVLRAPLPSGNRCQMERGAGDARAAAAQPGAHRRFRLRNVLCEPLFPSGGSSHTGCVAGGGKRNLLTPLVLCPVPSQCPGWSWGHRDVPGAFPGVFAAQF